MSRRYLKRKIKILLHELNLPNAVLGITFVTDRFMAGLNSRYRGKKNPTDVLSFSVNSSELLGDIVISVDTLRRQAYAMRRLLRDETMILIIHGLLHLLGYDHVVPKDERVMQKMERFLWERSHGFTADES